MSLIDDIAIELSNAGLGTIGVNIFKSYLPDTDTEAIAVLDTGGVKPEAEIPDMKSPTFQIFIRSSGYTAGKNRLNTIRSRLHAVQNRTLSGTYFYFIHAQSEGGHLGLNANGKDEFSINFICRTR